jgi:hypothetical protein
MSLMKQESLSTIQELEEEIKELVSENQQKSEMISSLNEQIGKLSESDKVLKLNEELKKQNENLQRSEQNARREAMTEVGNVKKEYASKIAEVDRQQEEATRLRQSQETEIRVQVLEQVHRYKNELDDKYNGQKNKLDSEAEQKSKELENQWYLPLTIVFVYGVFITLLSAIKSEAFRSDLGAFFKAIGSLIWVIGENGLKGASWVQGQAQNISQPVVAVILGVLGYLIVLILLWGIPYGLIGFVGYSGFKFYKEQFADRWSVLVALGSMAVCIFFAEEIKMLTSINLIFLFICLHILYLIIRMATTGSKSY